MPTDGLGRTVEDMLTLFYADDGLLSTKDREWLQKALDLLVSLFERIGLKTNESKTKLMVCLPAVKATRMTDGAYKRRMTGEGESYRERQRRKVTCPDCPAVLRLSSLRAHRLTQHGISTTALPPPVPDDPPMLYYASVPRLPARYREDVRCPVPGCPGSARTPLGMRTALLPPPPPTQHLCASGGERAAASLQGVPHAHHLQCNQAGPLGIQRMHARPGADRAP